MSENIVLVVLVCSCLLSLVWSLWSSVKALERTSGSSIRSSERERKEYHQTFERIMEKAISASHEQARLSQIHASERINSVNNAASVEKRAMTPPVIDSGGGTETMEAIHSVEEVAGRLQN